jgi:hypothetical protein
MPGEGARAFALLFERCHRVVGLNKLPVDICTDYCAGDDCSKRISSIDVLLNACSVANGGPALMLHVRRLIFALTLLRTGQLFSLVKQSPSVARAMWIGGTTVGDVTSPFAASLLPRVKSFGCAELPKPGEAKLLICKYA